MNDYCLPDGYVENPMPDVFDDDDNPGLVSQPDVYWHAAWLAEALGARIIVDVGCGLAEKLAHLHHYRPTWGYVGVDTPTMIGQCLVRYGSPPTGGEAWGAWQGVDLEEGLPGLRTGPGEYLNAPAVLVCADVVEHLLDPRPLLHDIYEARLNGVVAALISTPDRALTYGGDHLGPPPNPAHVREWTADELTRFLKSFLRTADLRVGHTRSDDANGGLSTTLVVL